MIRGRGGTGSSRWICFINGQSGHHLVFLGTISSLIILLQIIIRKRREVAYGNKIPITLRIICLRKTMRGFKTPRYKRAMMINMP
jgi:hypothetical protein